MNGFSYGWSSIIVSVTFIMLTYILIDKNEPKDFKNVLWSIIGGKIWLEVLIRMFFFKDSLCSLMLSLFQAWNIIMTAWFYKKRSKTIMLYGLPVGLYSFFGDTWPGKNSFSEKKKHFMTCTFMSYLTDRNTIDT